MAINNYYKANYVIKAVKVDGGYKVDGKFIKKEEFEKNYKLLNITTSINPLCECEDKGECYGCLIKAIVELKFGDDGLKYLRSKLGF